MQKPVYTRTFETRRYKSKIKIGIRLRKFTNLSGRKQDSATNRRCTLTDFTQKVLTHLMGSYVSYKTLIILKL